MDKIIKEVVCGGGAYTVSIRENWLVEISTGGPFSINIVLNYSSIDDFEKLAEMFHFAANHFRKNK